MAKIKYDVKDVESTRDISTPIPIGLYAAKVSEVEETASQRSGDPMLKITIDIASGEYKGRKLWDYIVLNEASAWKLRQFVDALGLKDSGTLDTKKIVGTEIQVRVKHETSSEYGTTARVGALLASPEGSNSAGSSEEDYEQADDEADDEELTMEDLSEYDREDLEAVIEEQGLEEDVKFNSRTPDETLRSRIAEALGLEGSEDEEEDDEDEEDEVEDYSDMSVADLRAECKDRGLKHTGPKSALVKRLEADDEEDGDEPF